MPLIYILQCGMHHRNVINVIFTLMTDNHALIIVMMSSDYHANSIKIKSDN